MAACPLLKTFALWLLVALNILSGCKRDHVETLTISGETFLVELAITEEARTKGMSFRESFPEGGLMLFVFPDTAIRSFWMVDCLIDMDIIFLDARGFVTATHRMLAEPLQGENEDRYDYENRLKRYSSRYPAQFAIELPAGSLDRLGVGFEDRIDLDLDRLKALAE
jgi:uncharacterized protein